MTSKYRIKLALETIAKHEKLTPELLGHLTNEERQLVETVFLQGSVIKSLNFIEDIDSETDWKSLEKQLLKPNTSVTPLWKSIMRYAALFVGVFVLGYAIQNKGNVEVEHHVSENDEIKLFLGNDKIEILYQGVNQKIKTDSDNVIAQKQGDGIIYSKHADIKELIFHQVVVPYGKVFKVKLSDGTIVHLNSGSKMRYPVKFLEGQKREVFIEGQAYFEVSKDKKHPFVVNADAVAIEVLGTKFDVSTYKEDSQIETVLVEGAVRMTNSYFPDHTVTLAPGSKGSWDKKDHQTKVEQVNAEIYTSWIKGELVFRNSTFENMTKKLERKYNVQIENNNSKLSNKVFNASFSENIETIEDVLKYIAEISPFHYEISNNHILIY